jgi:hypothetical protein
VLPAYDAVLCQVGNIGGTRLTTAFEDHPACVRPPETLVSRVGVEIGVGVSVVLEKTETSVFRSE